MNPSFHESTQHEDDDSLPDVSNLEDDLSLDNLTGEDVHEAHVEGAQDALDDEPEGIFALFDSEFRSREVKMPLNPEEKSKFGEEFLQGFDDMFDSVEGGEDLPFLSEVSSNSPATSFGNPFSTSSAASQNVEDEEEEEPLFEPGGMYQAEEDTDEDEPLPDDSANEFLSLNDYPEEDSLEEPLPMSLDEQSDDESLDADWSNFDAEYASDEDEDDELPQVGFEELSSDEDDTVTDSDSDDFFSDGAEWNSELEEISFDEDDEQEDDDDSLSDEDDIELLDEFTRIALGDDGSDEEDEEEDEDDFIIADISDTDAEPDPFEEIAIMSSEEVSEYTPSFGEEELKFEDDLPPAEDEDEDPFAMPSDGKKGKKASQDEEESLELDPFSEEAQSLQNQDSDEKDDSESDNEQDKDDKGDSKGSSNSRGLVSKLISLLLFPWNLYSKLTGLAFNLLNGVLRAVGGLPIVGIPFNLLANVLSAIPMFAKKIILLAFIGGIFSGVSLAIPSPSSSIELPDYGEAKFSGVELKDGVITGTIENKGDVIVSVFPTVEVSERKLLDVGTWFSPNRLGECTGDIVEVAIDNTAEVSFNCDIVSEGSLKIKPSLKE